MRLFGAKISPYLIILAEIPLGIPSCETPDMGAGIDHGVDHAIFLHPL
jgi:hypothetical protein